MSQPIPSTGPELFGAAESSHQEAQQCSYGSDEERFYQAAALFHATQAQTAAIILAARIQALACGVRSRDLEVWGEVIPAPPLVECWSKEKRRPQCEDRHTEDCTYADPVPEPPHVLLPVGTRVLIDPIMIKDVHAGTVTYDGEPFAAKITGYAAGRCKYTVNKELWAGHYIDYDSYIFVDNRVKIHPEGPECPEVAR